MARRVSDSDGRFRSPSEHISQVLNQGSSQSREMVRGDRIEEKNINLLLCICVAHAPKGSIGGLPEDCLYPLPEEWAQLLHLVKWRLSGHSITCPGEAVLFNQLVACRAWRCVCPSLAYSQESCSELCSVLQAPAYARQGEGMRKALLLGL